MFVFPHQPGQSLWRLSVTQAGGCCVPCPLQHAKVGAAISLWSVGNAVICALRAANPRRSTDGWMKRSLPGIRGQPGKEIFVATCITEYDTAWESIPDHKYTFDVA